MSRTTSDLASELQDEERKAVRYTVFGYLAILIAPMLAALGFASAILVMDLRTIDASRTEAIVLDVTHSAVRIVQELQKERGMSAGYLGSRGAQFTSELAAQRRNLDTALEQDLTHLLDVDTTGMPAYGRQFIDSKLAFVSARASKIAAHRARIDVFEPSAAENVVFYTEMVGALISLTDIRQIIHDVDTVATMNEATHALIMIGESGGLERATGAAGFGLGEFSTPLLARFTGLQAEQSAFIARFLELAPADSRAAFEAVLSGPVGQRIAELRSIALAGADTGDLMGITGPEWFDASTAYLSEVGRLRQSLSGKIDQVSANNQQAASRNILLLIVGTVLAVVLSLAAAIHQSMRMARPLRQLALSLKKLARGLVDVQVAGGERKDAVGLVARSMARITKQGAENTRVRAALSASSSPVMIVAPDGQLLFSNETMKAKAQKSVEHFKATHPDGDPKAALESMIQLAFAEVQASGQTDIAQLSASQSVEVRFDDRVFDVVVSPVFDPDRNRIGTTTEWQEVTATRSIEDQLGTMIEATQLGDFSQQLSIQSSQRHLNQMADGMNAICGQIDAIVTELRTALGALAGGDLTKQVSGNFKGELGALAVATNQTIEQLRLMVGNMINDGRDIDARSADIREGAGRLSDRSDSASTSLQSTASAMEEISSTVVSTAAIAKDRRNDTNPGKFREHHRYCGGY